MITPLKTPSAKRLILHSACSARLSLAAFCCVFIAGCASNTVAFKVDAVLSGRDGADVGWDSKPAEFSRSIGVVAKREGSTLETGLRFEGNRFWISTSVLSGGARISIDNKQTTPMCLRLDKTTLRSNYVNTPAPLKVWFAFFDQQNVPPRSDEKRFNRGQVYYILEPYCIAPMTAAWFTLVIDSSQLYPNAQLFNVRHAGGKILESGIGNTLILNLPLEVGGKLEEFEMRLKAIDEIYYNYSM